MTHGRHRTGTGRTARTAGILSAAAPGDTIRIDSGTGLVNPGVPVVEPGETR